MTTHDEQARKLIEAMLWASISNVRPDDNVTIKSRHVELLSTALAAAHLAGWRAARKAAARLCDQLPPFDFEPDYETATGGLFRGQSCVRALGDAIRALPDPVPAPTDPERAARLAEIRAKVPQETTIARQYFRGDEHEAYADIAYLLSLNPEATR